MHAQQAKIPKKICWVGLTQLTKPVKIVGLGATLPRDSQFCFRYLTGKIQSDLNNTIVRAKKQNKNNIKGSMSTRGIGPTKYDSICDDSVRPVSINQYNRCFSEQRLKMCLLFPHLCLSLAELATAPTYHFKVFLAACRICLRRRRSSLSSS